MLPSVEDAAKYETEYRAAAIADDARWRLGLLVANGAGLLAVSSRVLTASEAAGIEHLLIWAGWCFSVGLCLIGTAPAVAAKRLVIIADGWGEAKRCIRIGQPFGRYASRRDAIWAKVLYWVETVQEWGSAAALAMGVTYPLAALTARYYQSGGFSG